MNRSKVIPLILIIVQYYLTSCDEIFEKDLSGEEIFLIAPCEDCITTYSSQTFLWDPVDGAIEYLLQIVTPSFTSAELLLTDTILTENRFDINLFPGKFEWRVRAQNGSSRSTYFLRTLEIDSTRDLQGHQVYLIYPESDKYVNSGTLTFKWNKLYNADYYTIKLYHNKWENEPVLSSDSINIENITVENLEEGSYVWGVSAQNYTSSTDFSKRAFHVDMTPPGIPVLTTPENNAVIKDQDIIFSWNNNQDPGSPINDSLFISSDSLFKSGSSFLKRIQSESPFNFAVLDTGTYFWKVKLTDSAGNQGQFSLINRFKRRNL